MSLTAYRDGDGERIEVHQFTVYHNFPEVMGIDVLEGKFQPELKESQLIMTKQTQLSTGWEVGKMSQRLRNLFVAGVCENIELKSLADKQMANHNMVLVYHNKFQIGYNMFLVRIAPNTDIEQMKEFIRESVQEFDPGAEEPTIRFFRDDFEQLYVQTRRQAVLLSIFAVLSVIISLMGVFGIVLFEMQHRRHEIAIRRVFGATTSGMLWMLNSRYAKIVVACFVVAAPVAWYIVGEWQKDFAQQAPIGWWVYLLALLLVLGITLGLVTQRSWRAANENPARVIKGE